MKKLWSESGTRFLTQIRQRETQKYKERKEAKRQGRASRERARRTLQARIARGQHLKLRPIELLAPENFSLIENTDEMLDFLFNIEQALAQNFQPRLDMREIKSLSIDGILVLNFRVSALVNKYEIAISGSEPRIPALADVLRRSGFYEHVTRAGGSQYVQADRGIMSHEERQVVDTKQIERLVHFATNILYGAPRDHQSTYAALGELMQNTFDHADRSGPGKEHWWASVFYDQHNDVVHFTFLDTGVGIFGSRPVKLLDKWRSSMNLESDPELLKQIFEGKLASRTGIAWRGQGLPRIYRRVHAGQLTDMTVITNKVKGHLDDGKFVSLTNEFTGTLYHWEMQR